MDLCAICKKDAPKNCGRCKCRYYCSVACQKKDWKTHSKECFAPDAKCTRCLQTIPFPPGKCLIEHPEHLLEDRGSSFGAGLSTQSYGCLACMRTFTKTATLGTGYNPRQNDFNITSGPKYCYEGRHTVKPLKTDDQQRFYDDMVTLACSGQELQSKINALDGNEKVRFLVIKADGSYFDEDSKPRLNVKMPNLEELKCIDVDVGQLVLTEETTPKLKKLWMQNPSQSNEPDFVIKCPELREIGLFYWGPGDYEWVHNMLQYATKLEEFDSYKFRCGHLVFASNNLKSIRLHRAELLQRLDIWAPRLEDLNVQAAYDLEEIHFMESHSLEAELPDGFHHDAELHVNSTNISLGRQAKAAIRAHPRFHGALEQDHDDYFGSPMEQMFMNMRNMM